MLANFSLRRLHTNTVLPLSVPTLKTVRAPLSTRMLAAVPILVIVLTLATAAHSPQVQAQARNYLIEVVVFENMAEAKKASSGSLYYPRINSAIGLTGDKAASLGFALLDDALTLDEAAQKIRASGKYRLLKHFAWRQPGLDAKNAQAVRINIGKTMPIYLPDDLKPFKKFIPASAQPQPTRTRKITTTTVSGTLKVRLGRFLHLDTLLVFTDTENQKSYRMSQSRKMRSTEFHYIDNPRFGLLVRILPLEEASN